MPPILKKESLLNSKMELFITDNGEEIFVRDMEFKSGLMEPNTKVNGLMAKLTEKVLITL